MQQAQIPQQKIDIQTALVRFINNNRIVLIQIRIALNLRQQHPIRHHLDPRLGHRLILKPNFAPHLGTPRNLQLLCNAPRHGQRRHAPRLSTRNFCRHTAASLQTHFGQLCRLPRSRLTRHNHHRMFSNRPDNLILPRCNRQRFWIRHRQRILPAVFPQRRRPRRLYLQFLQPHRIAPLLSL